MNKKFLVGGLAVAVAIAGGAFFGGYKYAQSKSPFARLGGNGGNQQFRFQTGANQNGMAMAGGRTVQFGGGTFGEILDISGSQMTVKLADGSSRVVILSNSTAISKTATGSTSDLKVGESVSVMGSTNSDNSVTAQQIQIRPILPSSSPAR
ncbi:MAG TPA: DUF5666 domain-containing protein [Candidatus Paceibacterota bacterium]|nr:DUF5666 domain-containing protein [Candidatus Paceibacterota bacterium]